MVVNRLLDPCTDEKCDWVDDTANYMTTRRWYPTLEVSVTGHLRFCNLEPDRTSFFQTLEDGSAIIASLLEV